MQKYRVLSFVLIHLLILIHVSGYGQEIIGSIDFQEFFHSFLKIGTINAGVIMVFIAFFSMSAKFVSCTLGQLYRKVNDDGSVSGGPMYYLDYGLKEKGLGTFGKILGSMYAIFVIGGAFGGGNMFQANQSYELFGKLIGIPNYLYGFLLAILVGIVVEPSFPASAMISASCW